MVMAVKPQPHLRLFTYKICMFEGKDKILPFGLLYVVCKGHLYKKKSNY